MSRKKRPTIGQNPLELLGKPTGRGRAKTVPTLDTEVQSRMKETLLKKKPAEGALTSLFKKVSRFLGG